MTSFGFLPIFDLLNHSSTPNAFLQIRNKHVWDKTKKIHPEEKFILSLEAKTKIAKGEELRLSYGSFSDRELFLKYGFVLKKGENKAGRLLVSSKMVHETGINASGAYCSYDALNVTIKERKEVVRELCSDEFYLEKASNDKNTSLNKAAMAFILNGTTKESIILHIKERLGVNQKTNIALKHFYVFLAESVKSKTKEELAELEFRMCRERNPVKYHLLKSLKENEIALANELYEIHNNQLQILKNNEKGGKLQKTPPTSDACIRETSSSGNQNILSRIREKLARKSRTTDDTKVVSVAERAAGFAKIMKEKEKIQEPVARNIQTRRSMTRSEMKGRRESDSDMSMDSGYSYRTDASKNSFLSASSIYSSDRPRSGRTYERPQFSPKPSLTRSHTSTDRASFSRSYERGSYFNRSDSVERRSRVNAAINTYSSSPTASSFSSSGRYDRSYRIPSLSSSSYSSSSSSSALTTTGRYSSRNGIKA